MTPPPPPTNECNCRSRNKSLSDGKCLIKSIVYQETVTTNANKPHQTYWYVGLTANTFKTRFTNHKAWFTSAKKKHSTELSKYIWQKNIDHEIKWKILKRTSPYSNTCNRCNLCLWEKCYIICKPIYNRKYMRVSCEMKSARYQSLAELIPSVHTTTLFQRQLLVELRSRRRSTKNRRCFDEVFTTLDQRRWSTLFLRWIKVDTCR